jgi:type I restriction enzyme R subunit
VRRQLDQVGTLDLLRQGVEMLGLPKDLKLAEFKPAFGLNPQILARYNANRLRVVRQVRYSTRNQNCLDLVLVLNGIPVATCELKIDNTQSIADAVWQYKADRDPRPAGQAPELLLSFPSGALVPFAVSNREVQMTSRLEGARAQFLPFNRGSDPGGANCGAGNPLSAGHATGYLWEEVWERHSWLEILGRYCIAERDKKKQIRRLVFPRYHQLAVTRLLLLAVLEEGPGLRYQIQHSAGSGKTASIGWSAHLLADLHDKSDRSVIDTQLQETLENFERRKGVVASITSEKGIKSEQLAAAADKLKQVLSAAEVADLADGGEVDIETLLAAQMGARTREAGITYVTYTATPKAKTLEFFGRLPNLNEPAGPGNLPAPFLVYSMRQAIEEGFILDVLQNYTSNKVAFRLAQDGHSRCRSWWSTSASSSSPCWMARTRRWWWWAPAGRPCAGSSPSISTSRSRAIRSAPWWPSAERSTIPRSAPMASPSTARASIPSSRAISARPLRPTTPPPNWPRPQIPT